MLSIPRRLAVFRWVVAVALLVGILPGAGGGAWGSGSGSPERFSDRANPTWGTSSGDHGDNRAGKVSTIVEAGSHVYFGGEFTGVVPPGVKVGSNEGLQPRRSLARLDIDSGELDQSWNPDPDGSVRALAASPDGSRLYVGGFFKNIDGQAARRLVAFDVATGRLDPTFVPPEVSAGVMALAVSPDGRRLYAGGGFHSVQVRGDHAEAGKHERPLLAAFDARTGALLDWQGPAKAPGRYVEKGHKTSSVGDGAVYVLAVTRDGLRLYAAGDFLRLGGRDGLVSLDAASGQPTPWQPGETCKVGWSTCRPFYGVALAPDDPDTFYGVADGFGGLAVSFTYGKAAKGNWQVRSDGAGHAVAATAKVVYFGGHFDYVLGGTTCAGSSCAGGKQGDIPRQRLIALDAKTGTPLPDEWTATANTNTGPYTAYLGARHLYIGGEFNRISGLPQPGIVQFPAKPEAQTHVSAGQ